MKHQVEKKWGRSPKYDWYLQNLIQGASFHTPPHVLGWRWLPIGEADKQECGIAEFNSEGIMIDRSKRRPKSVSMLMWFVPNKFVVTILIFLFAFIEFLRWGGSRPDPCVTMQQLRGLTPDQVISRLGPPRYDPRQINPRDPPTTQMAAFIKEGAFDFIYRDVELPATGHFDPHFGHVYVIRFKMGHVIRVSRSGGGQTPEEYREEFGRDMPKRE